MKRIKKFFQDFKKFISRGNVVDMAIGVIVASAFTAIVTALTNKIIMPCINWLLSLGGAGLDSAYTFLKVVRDPVTNAIDLTKSIYIDWGAFITAIIDFFIIAFVIFSIVKLVNISREKLQDMAEDLEEMSSKEFKAEVKEIRKRAKQEGRKFKEVWAEHEAEKKRMSEEKAKILAEEKAKQEAEARKLNPTQEDLLKEIRDLLKEEKSKK